LDRPSDLSTPRLLQHLTMLAVNHDWCSKHGVPSSRRLVLAVLRRAAAAEPPEQGPGSGDPQAHSCTPPQLLQLLLCLDALGRLRPHPELMEAAVPVLLRAADAELEAAMQQAQDAGVPVDAASGSTARGWVQSVAATVAGQARRSANEGWLRVKRQAYPLAYLQPAGCQQVLQALEPASSGGGSGSSSGSGEDLQETLARLAAASSGSGSGSGREACLDELQAAQPQQLARLDLRQLAALRLALLAAGRPQPEALPSALLSHVHALAAAHQYHPAKSRHLGIKKAARQAQLAPEEALTLADCLHSSAGASECCAPAASAPRPGAAAALRPRQRMLSLQAAETL
jgi:hypothetical protein